MAKVKELQFIGLFQISAVVFLKWLPGWSNFIQVENALKIVLTAINTQGYMMRQLFELLLKKQSGYQHQKLWRGLTLSMLVSVRYLLNSGDWRKKAAKFFAPLNSL